MSDPFRRFFELKDTSDRWMAVPKHRKSLIYEILSRSTVASHPLPPVHPNVELSNGSEPGSKFAEISCRLTATFDDYLNWEHFTSSIAS
jgi:hypothetical protein